MYLEEFQKLVEIMTRLRKECPWDREQTPETLRQYIIEEAYETVEAIDDANWGELKKELGDLLLQIVFQAEIAREENRFELHEVIANINQKLIDRHPHVFGDTSVENSDQVRDNWEQIKMKSEKRESILQGIPAHLPGLLRAQRVQDKASQAGFDWPDPNGVIDKMQEEIEELRQARSPAEVFEEIGDMLFTLVNLCRFHKISAEDALRATTTKFITRFQYIEKTLAGQDRRIQDIPLEEAEQLWQEAKGK
ncbi:MAG TPA: nucleoside triphosphate pyrophosphohydrolase [Calditrichia bacterium]|nr:nucleoside triphosphate pyrophosphohydrolase [Calditrichota bacterium]HQU74945.1 nucleoside triphosphate pyrophosphohydrolase [Calditrichia bacterium]HQV32259.1 nucleoside triphosphate pyrophosphohydrolase [Calditrichia bacterium]